MIARRVLSKYRSDQASRSSALVEQPPKAIKNVASSDLEALAQRDLLSPREHEVLALIARGFSYAEIARLQGLSVHTVQTHIKNLYGKLSVHSKSEAVFEATRMGLL
jgi:DNA-binding CsgD family transcriptional regulator